MKEGDEYILTEDVSNNDIIYFRKGQRGTILRHDVGDFYLTSLSFAFSISKKHLEIVGNKVIRVDFITKRVV
jgi:hypothetical protein